MTHAAVKRQAGDSSRGDHPGRNDQPVKLRLPVDVAERGATLHPNRLCPGVDVNASHQREIDDQPTITARRYRRRYGHLL